MNKSKYTVTAAIKGYYTTKEITAATEVEEKSLALTEVNEADFGSLHDVEYGSPVKNGDDTYQFEVRGYAEAEVEAASELASYDEADEVFYEMNFGFLRDVSWGVIREDSRMTADQLRDECLKASPDDKPRDMMAVFIPEKEMVLAMQFGFDQLLDEDRDEGYTEYIDYEAFRVDDIVKHLGEQAVLKMSAEEVFDLDNDTMRKPLGQYTGLFLLKEEDVDAAKENIPNLIARLYDDLDLKGKDGKYPKTIATDKPERVVYVPVTYEMSGYMKVTLHDDSEAAGKAEEAFRNGETIHAEETIDYSMTLTPGMPLVSEEAFKQDFTDEEEV